MKSLLFIVGCFSLPAGIWGQVKITGRIVAGDGKPIPYANVLLLNTLDTTLVKGCMANESGEYEIKKVEPGMYFLRYTAIGFLTSHSAAFGLTASEGNKKFDAQIMEVDVRQLKEVVVRTGKPLYQQQIYGTVVNVESSVLSKGSSAVQVLERSPGIYLDHHHNTIAMNGKSGVLVMINGKVLRLPMTQVLNLLGSMSADNIEKIELLTTPPAKYDAEGDAGMINIVLKKNREYGTNGSFSISGGYGQGEKGTGSISLAHNTRKVDIYGSYTFSHDKGGESWFANGSEVLPVLGGMTSFDFWSEIRPVVNSQNATLGLDVRLTPTTKIGASINYNHSGTSNNVYNLGNYYIQPDSFRQLNATIKGVGRLNNLITSYYIEHKVSERESINFDIDYIYYGNDNPSDVQSSFLDKNGNTVATPDSLFAPHLKGLSNTAVHIGVGKVDYMKQLSKKYKLEAGLKWTYTRSSDLSAIQSPVDNEWVSLYDEYARINLKETIGAAYASFNAELNPSTSLVLGLRYEYSHTLLNDMVKGQAIGDRRLGGLFPTIFFSRKLNESSELQLSYSKRINRPSYLDLAPNIRYNDPVSIFTGTPLLRSTITNNLKIGYNYHGYSFSVLLGRDNYPISRYQVVAGPTAGLAYISPQNLTWQNNLIFEAKLPWKINEWWNVSGGFVGGWRQFKVDYSAPPVVLTYFDYSVYATQTFKLPKKFTLEISGTYNSLTYEGANKVTGFGMLNAGIKKELKNEGGAFELSVSDVLRSVVINSYLGQVTAAPFSLKSRVSYSPESRKTHLIMLTYSRSFGNNHEKSQRQWGTGSKDEQDRVKKN